MCVFSEFGLYFDPNIKHKDGDRDPFDSAITMKDDGDTMSDENVLSSPSSYIKTRPDTRLPKLRAGGQGLYLR